MAAHLVAGRWVNPQQHAVKRSSQLILEQVQSHRSADLRIQVQYLLEQLQAGRATHQKEVLDRLDTALRNDLDDALIVARAHLSALRGMIEDEDLIPGNDSRSPD